MKLLRDPNVALLGVVIAAATALRGLFVASSAWLWSFAKDVDLSLITPWGRWTMENRDGLEPYAMLAIVGLQWLLTALGVFVLARLPPRWRLAAVVALLVGVVRYALEVPLRPPLPKVDPWTSSVVHLIAACLLAIGFVRWTMRGARGVPWLLAAVLVPFCFVRVTLPSLLDLTTILAPALQLHDGVAPSQIFMQYDLLPSLLALGWRKIGGDSLSFWIVLAAVFYATLLGLFVVGRRLFSRPSLVAPMLVAIVFVRCYAVWGDVLTAPQTGPVRLDLWLGLVAATLAVGLRHWLVGLLVACLCFFSRSVGILYLGAYFLALGADFLAERRDTPVAARAPLKPALRALLVAVAPSLGWIVLSFVASRLVFGSFGSPAVSLYRELGLGMMRVDAKSFYWWLLPMTGAVGWLAFSRRGTRPPRPAQAAIFAVALVAVNSVYFFGRSHEHNILNLSISFLFCAYLGLDLAWPAGTDDSPIAWALFHGAALAIVVVPAYFYSGRALEKLTAQVALLDSNGPTPSSGNEKIPDLHCDEIDRVSPDGHVYVFSGFDYWYYDRCRYVPRAYFQPMFLAAFQQSLIDDVTRLVNDGYKVIVPSHPGDFATADFAALIGRLPKLDVSETPHFTVYARHPESPK
jgi:hypothetical protein